MSYSSGFRQQGVALVVALLFLLVVTVISVIAATNSSLGLKMSANMADSYDSFQAAEAGVVAALGLAGTDDDPFDATTTLHLFDPNDPASPLRQVNDGPGSVDVNVFSINDTPAPCPRSSSGSSVGLFDCDYYRISSDHEVKKKARTRVQLGVVKTTIGSGT